MLSKTSISNGISLLKSYCPNLFEFITEKDFGSFLRRSYNHTMEHGGGTPNNNFIVTFFELLKEHSLNHSTEIRSEFCYFNFLLGEFLKITNPKKFKDLVKGSLLNLETNNFKHSLGEAAACVELCQLFNFVKYEITLENGKSVDLHFQRKGQHDLYVEVYNIEINEEKYEKHNFQSFLNGRLLEKFISKSTELSKDRKKQIIIYPILNGISVDIVKEQEFYLKSLNLYKLTDYGFQSFEPKCFGNIQGLQGTIFNLFSIDQIVNPRKYY